MEHHEEHTSPTESTEGGPPSSDGSAGPRLSAEQEKALEKVLQGRNVFITGGGGVGKSYLVERIIVECEARKKRIAITATTGVAAVSIGGTTLHSFAKIGLGKDPMEVLLRQVRTRKSMREPWLGVDILLIDEVSMLHPGYLARLEQLARVSRRRLSLPFGGLQVVLVGDFFQLPPVQRGSGEAIPSCGLTRDMSFCFELPLWDLLIADVVPLVTPFRQPDLSFAALLERVRRGRPTRSDLEVLRSRVGVALDESDGIRPTDLHPRIDQVERINQDHLDRLEGEAIPFAGLKGSRPRGELSPTDRKRQTRLLDNLVQDCPAKPALVLKDGAQVILLANLDLARGLVNGSRGVVVRFSEEPDRFPVVRFGGGSTTVTIRRHCWTVKDGNKGEVWYAQVPLKLAYALTIHKCQSQSLDKVSIRLDGSIFEPGQAYVALSRVRTLAGLVLTAFDDTVIRAHPKAKRFYERIEGVSDESGTEAVEEPMDLSFF